MAKEDFLTLSFDDGAEIEFEIMGVFECDGKEYIALAEMNEEGDDYTGEVFIYGYKEIGKGDDAEFELLDINDEAEFEKAVAEFDSLMAEEE